MTEHISNDSGNLKTVFERMVDVMNGVKDGTMSSENGHVIARAGNVACNSIETDLRARVVNHRLVALEEAPQKTPQLETTE